MSEERTRRIEVQSIAPISMRGCAPQQLALLFLFRFEQRLLLGESCQDRFALVATESEFDLFLPPFLVHGFTSRTFFSAPCSPCSRRMNWREAKALLHRRCSSLSQILPSGEQGEV